MGLANAIRTKLLANQQNRDISILLLDKRTVYERGHTVHTDRATMKSLALKVDGTAGELAETITEYNALLEELSGNTPILEMERKLAAFAEKIAITIRRGVEHTVGGDQTFASLIEKYKPRIAIAAGGYRSAAAAEVFGSLKEQRAVDIPMGHILKAKFYVAEKPLHKKIGLGVQLGRFAANPWFSRNRDDKTGMFKGQAFTDLSDEEAKLLRSLGSGEDGNYLGSYKNPIRESEMMTSFGPREFHGNSQDRPVRDLRYLRAITMQKLQEIGAQDVKATIIPLGAYKSKEYFKNYHGATVLKVGDAAAGVPYQRSLCGSLQGVVQSSKVIVETLEQEDALERAEMFKDLSKDLDRIWDKEIFWARVKYIGLKILSFFAKVFNAIGRAFTAGPSWVEIEKMEQEALEKSEREKAAKEPVSPLEVDLEEVSA